EMYLNVKESSGRFYIQYANYHGAGGSTSVDTLNSNQSYVENEWHYITLTVAEQGSNIEVHIYLDGVDVSDGNNVFLKGNVISGSTFNIGNLNYDTDSKSFYHLNGSIDEFMFFNHVLTPTDVNNLYETLATEYQITGTVTKDGEPNANEVMIYNRTTAKLEDKVTSNASTGEFDLRWREYDPSQEYFVIAIDDDGVPHLDPIGHDRITKTEVT
ncbi:MAG TPA: LamG domain-containing protein, partial [Methylophaga sp.]|nr:LamG domain-containing protein [Methylophaga sp.]